MRIELDDREPGDSMLSGRVVDAPPGAVELTLHVRTSTPKGATEERMGSVTTTDGTFSLERPVWPISYVGELLSVEWNLVARHEAGVIAAHEIYVVADAIQIEVPAGHHRAVSSFDRIVLPIAVIAALAGIAGVVVGIATDRTWLWVIAGFLVFFAGVALAGPVQRKRRRRVYGSIECTVEQRDDVIEFVVTADPPADLPAVTVTASLTIVEMTGRADDTRTGGTREHIAAQHTIELSDEASGDGRHRWRGTLPPAALEGAPLSQFRRSDAGTTSVSWVTHVRLIAPGAPDVEQLIPLVALPVGLDERHRPEFVDVPKLIR